MYINGEFVSASTGATFERRNPIDNQVTSCAPAASIKDAQAAVEAAANAFPDWSALAPSSRRAILLQAAATLEAMTPSFTEVIPLETGGTVPWSNFNVNVAAGMLTKAAALVTRIGGEVIPSDIPGSLAMSIRQPAGVVLGIAPWNAPVILAVRAIATPLTCGKYSYTQRQ